MRQHAILSCLLLLLGWSACFSMSLFQAINTTPVWADKALFLSVFPLSLLMAFLQRNNCKKIVFRANIFGFFLLFLLLLGQLYAGALQYHDWQLFARLLMVPVIVFSSLGLRAFWALFFPCVAVLCAHPGLALCREWVQVEILSFTGAKFVKVALSDGALSLDNPTIILLSDFSLYWLVISAFYGYFRYKKMPERICFYGISIGTFFMFTYLQVYALKALFNFGGYALLAQFNWLQLNELLLILGLSVVGYTLWVLFPYKPPLRRMMNESTDFTILVDRHSHWFMLTIIALCLMGLSVWLGANLHHKSWSAIAVW